MGLTWNLMMSAGLLSLGHGLFLGLGAYATAVFTATGGLSPWVSILIGAAISAAAGSAIAWIGGRFSVRGVQFALLTIAFAELARVLFDNWDFVGSTGGFFLKAINPDTNQPLLTLRGGTLFFYLAFVLITAAAYFLIRALMPRGGVTAGAAFTKTRMQRVRSASPPCAARFWWSRSAPVWRGWVAACSDSCKAACFRTRSWDCGYRSRC